jgi:hypothetical protein
MFFPIAYEGDERTGAFLQRALDFDGEEREALRETHGQVSLDRAVPWREEIDGRPVARVSDPTTSWQAAADANRGAATLRARCLSALREAGDLGLTDFDLADVVHSQQTSAGKRRKELMDAGLVENSGRTRPAPSGSQAIVWRVTR